MNKINKILILIAAIFLFFLFIIYLNFISSKKGSIRVGDVSRDYLLHLPKSSEKIPLVVALHGYKDNPRLMEFYTGLSRKADKEKFAVVYPYGTKSTEDKYLSWNGGSCCGNGVVNNVEDIDFINSLTDELIKNNNIDPTRIYLVGFSNGGLLAYKIFSETPDRYKAFAVISGSIGGKVYKNIPEYVIPQPHKPASVLVIHGMKDSRIPYYGGENTNKDGSFKSFNDSKKLWSENNGCSGAKLQEDDLIIRETFLDCKDNVKTEFYSVKDGGHVWFGSVMEFPENFLNETVTTTDIIWKFFSNQ